MLAILLRGWVPIWVVSVMSGGATGLSKSGGAFSETAVALVCAAWDQRWEREIDILELELLIDLVDAEDPPQVAWREEASESVRVSKKRWL